MIVVGIAKNAALVSNCRTALAVGKAILHRAIPGQVRVMAEKTLRTVYSVSDVSCGSGLRIGERGALR